MTIPTYILRDPDSCYVIRDMETLTAWLDYPDQRRNEHHEVNKLAMTQFANYVGSIKVPKKYARKYQQHCRRDNVGWKLKNTWKRYDEFTRFRLPNVGKTLVEGDVTTAMRETMTSYLRKWIDSVKRYEHALEKKIPSYAAGIHDWYAEDVLENVLDHTDRFPADWRKDIFDFCLNELRDYPKWVKFILTKQDRWYFSNEQCEMIQKIKDLGHLGHLEHYTTPEHTPDIEKVIRTYFVPFEKMDISKTLAHKVYKRGNALINILVRLSDKYPELLEQTPLGTSRAWIHHLSEYSKKYNTQQRKWSELRAMYDIHGVRKTFQQWIHIEKNKEAIIHILNHAQVTRPFHLVQLIGKMIDKRSFFDAMEFLTGIPFDRDKVDELTAVGRQIILLNPEIKMTELYITLCKPPEIVVNDEYHLDL